MHVKFQPVIRPEPDVTLDLAKQHGLTDEEYERMLEILGRKPSYTELGIFSVMWSEHCSYKNSIAVLKTLPRSGGRLLVGAGEENAGLVDIGDGLAVAFKIESHNHPSAVEPYQGAATGVGGILRDIFSMGARPIAVLNSLRFGNLADKQVQYLFKQVVKGIADYGNSFGVPTIAGEVYFEECYDRNPLVNAMAIGIVEHENVATAVSRGVGNSVMIVGSSTGRDGIHGATFASEEISEKSEAKRPAVQVGDPFTEKLLLEATLEAIKSGYVVGVQDMGAAGITCSTTEMSAKGSSGMKLQLDAVPLRESEMTAYEILLSESQERMLFVVKRGFEEEINKIFHKWDLHAETIGQVVAQPNVSFTVGEKNVAAVPPEPLVLGGGAPVYVREAREPAYFKATRDFDPNMLPKPERLHKLLLQMLSRPNIASKRFVFQQYDSMVQVNSAAEPGGDSGIVRLKGTKKGLAASTDCNSKYVYLNPRRGSAIAVAESARNVISVGAEPIAITNCLNFGNPYDPEVYYQFKESVAGLGEACRVLGTPVTGGNVSFYNESPSSAIYPTPVIGMLGLIEDMSLRMDPYFKKPGDDVILVGETLPELGGSEYQQLALSAVRGDAPALDLTMEKRTQAKVLELIRERLVKSVHDVSEGGVAICCAESLFGGNSVGFRMEKDWIQTDMRADFALFSESQSRFIVSCDHAQTDHILAAFKSAEIASQVIGVVTERADFELGGTEAISVRELREAYDRSIGRLVGVEE